MAVRAFDRIKIAVGSAVYTEEYPHGKTITVAFEQQCHCVVPEQFSPEGFGDIVTWRSASNPVIHEWTDLVNATVVVPREGPQ
jgi:hypothetical protein